MTGPTKKCRACADGTVHDHAAVHMVMDEVYDAIGRAGNRHLADTGAKMEMRDVAEALVSIVASGIDALCRSPEDRAMMLAACQDFFGREAAN